MKKIIRIFLLIFLSLIYVNSCNKVNGEKKIVQAVCAFYDIPEDYVKVKNYFGEYDDSTIALIDCPSHNTQLSKVNQLIGDLFFEFESSSKKIYVYKNKSLYTLKLAYDNRIISYSTLKDIHRKHNTTTNESINLNNITKEKFINSFKEKYDKDDCKIIEYYGKYESVYMMLTNNSTQENIITIDGIVFEFEEGQGIYFYKDDVIYTLKEFSEKYGNEWIYLVEKMYNYTSKIENIDVDEERDIIKSLAYKMNTNFTNVLVYQYVDYFDGCYVVDAANKWLTNWMGYNTLSQKIGDYYFYYIPQTMRENYVIKDAVSYTIKEAYDNQIINDEDLKRIFCKYYKPEINNTLLDENILATFLKQYIGINQYNDLFNFKIQHNFGNYNGYDVVLIETTKEENIRQSYNVVAGYRFIYSKIDEKIMLYKDNVLYSLPMAYENNFLNEQDVYKIHNEYKELKQQRYQNPKDFDKISNLYKQKFGKENCNISSYYGEYNGYEVYCISDRKSDETRIKNDVMLFGAVDFYCYKDDILITVDEAYNSGIIDKNMYFEIYELYYNTFWGFDIYSSVYDDYKIDNPYKIDDDKYLRFLSVCANNRVVLDKVIYVENDFIFYTQKENEQKQTFYLYDQKIKTKQEVYVYYLGKIYTLKQLYLDGILSKNVIESIKQAL